MQVKTSSINPVDSGIPREIATEGEGWFVKSSGMYGSPSGFRFWVLE
jgi:hypothetical protein